MSIRQGRIRGLAIAIGLALMLTAAGCGSSSKGDSAQGSETGRGAGGVSSSVVAEESGGGPSEGGSTQSGWTATTVFQGEGPPAEIEKVERISCAVGPFCMVLSNGESVTFDGSSFSSSEPISTDETESFDVRDPNSLSCASSSFCMMIGESYGYYTWDGSSWQSGGQLEAASVGGLSCAADDQCVAVEMGDGTGANVFDYRDGTWSTVPMDPDGQLITGVSCASVDYCVVIGNDGDVFSFDPKTGASPELSPASSIHANFSAVSCVEGPFCLGADHTRGTVFEDHGTGFEQQHGIPPLLDIEPGACGSASFCLVRPVSSYQYTRLDRAKLEPIAQPPGNPELEFMSCTAEEVCMASVAETDEVLVYGP